MSTYVKSIKFWMRVLKMSPHRLPYKSYKMLLYLQARNRRKWASSVCYVLYRYGFDEVWENQGVGDEKLFLKEFKDWLLTLYKQKRVTSLRTNDHFSFYSTFKSNLSLSPYLNGQKCLYKNKAGSFATQADLACQICRNNAETEMHFILIQRNPRTIHS